MENWQNYKEQLDKFKEQLENGNYDVERDVVELQRRIEDAIEQCFDDKAAIPYRKILKELEVVKREFDFYDEEGELDMMFPDRHDDDFDQDSMNIREDD